ncbi:MAG TPA: GH1 family beta-glucosidase [Candidatus Synoicihabitans sp.]|nr:GH1 family beta-glucosidase [Candidatus Synoicihabitans sp.]
MRVRFALQPKTGIDELPQMRAPYSFPSKFVWGVATSAPQIEGGANEDGKGESIWDRFAAQPGRVRDGDTPAVACNHFHRFAEDFALMKQLGIRHYRFSFAWPRIHPDGGAAVNRAGIAFYHRLLDAMERNGVEPWGTLYHWDLPQALEDLGGWRGRATSDAFARYAATVVREFGTRIQHWITLNEIPTFIGHGYRAGVHAPGAREAPAVVAQAFHHALLAHGHGVAAVREYGGSKARVGLAHDLLVPIPVTETPEDIAAAEAELVGRYAHLLAPIFQGRYPLALLRRRGLAVPSAARGDLALISQPIDFLGLNIYSGDFVRAGRKGRPEVLPFPPNYPHAAPEWLRLAPQSIYWALRHCHSVYRPRSMYITENGAGFDDPAPVGGEVLDLHRRDYLRNHLVQVHRACAEGIPCRGYFAWSFLDNFEWAEGYAQRFGLVHVNYDDQRRTPKLSAHWYARVMRENRIV